MKKSEFISRITNGLNAISKDTRISRRYILNVGKNVVKDFLAKHIENYRDLDLITTIDCFELKPDNIIKCDIVEFRRCSNLMKSVCKLPETLNGFAVVSVYSIDDGTEFKPVSLKQFRRNMDRGGDYFPEYYIKNDHLYLPNSFVSRIAIDLITLELENICDCKPKDECQDIYETEFVVPSKFIENVVKTTIQEIAYKKQMPIDNNPNLNGEN